MHTSRRPPRAGSMPWPWLGLACAIAATAGACASDSDGSGGGAGDETAGVAHDKYVGSLTQEDATALCQHFDAAFTSIDETKACCTARAFFGALVPGADTCGALLSECEAAPADFNCAADTTQDSCDEPPPTCEGDVTVGQVATCLDDQIAAYQAKIAGVSCQTSKADFLSLAADNELPTSCEIVITGCPDLL